MKITTRKDSFKAAMFDVGEWATIRVDDQIIHGYICNEIPFAIDLRLHDDFTDAWHITHTLTGFRLPIKFFKTKKATLNFLGKLADLNLDWNFKKAGGKKNKALLKPFGEFLLEHYPDRILNKEGVLRVVNGK
jgi:hypothetical protein